MKMNRQPLTSRLALGAITLSCGVFAACVGDPATSSDAGTDAAVTPEKDASTPTADASVPDTASNVPDTSTPDTSVPFDPKQVGGLVLWLDPASGVTDTAGKVSAWADVSSSAIVVSQPTAANQPSRGTLGGKPVLAFSSTTWLDCAAATVGTKLHFGMGDVLAEAVVSLDSGAVTPLGGFFYKTSPDQPYDGLQLYTNLGGAGKIGGGLDGQNLILTAPSGSVADGKLHLVGFRRVGDRLSIRVDGAEVATKTVPSRTIDSTTTALEVGGRASGVHSTGQKLGDLVIYKGTMADTDMNRIETYLKAKSGI